MAVGFFEAEEFPAEFQRYLTRYQDFHRANLQQRVTTMVAQAVFADWPKGLPEPLRTSLDSVFTQANKALSLEPQPSDGEGPRVRVFGLDDTQFGMLVFKLSAFARSSDGTVNVDAGTPLASTELVMILAHLDAFLSDSVRAICRVRPEVMASGKKVSWENVIRAGSWESLLMHLEERFVVEFGWKTYPDKVAAIRKRFGLEIALSGDELAELVFAAAIRHMVVHNGGRANEDFINDTRRFGHDLKVGDPIPASMIRARDVYSKAMNFAVAVYNEVSPQFLGIDPVLRRRPEGNG